MKLVMLKRANPSYEFGVSPSTPNARPSFGSHVEHVVQVLKSGEWVTTDLIGTGTVVAFSNHDTTPGSFDAENLVAVLPDEPIAHSVDGVTYPDGHPKEIDLTEYVMNSPDGLRGFRQALLEVRSSPTDS